MARRDPADTPLMRQFLGIKKEHPDGILFFRMGDFYEMFFEDAVIAARALDLTLTSRDKGKADAIPMCGVPHHAGRGYIAKLTEKGHKVVLVEQTEDPKQAKGLVRREVVRVITPGVVIDDDVLDPKQARYVAAIAEGTRSRYGLAYGDLSTGELRATELVGLAALEAELARTAPREVLLGEASKLQPWLAARRQAAYGHVPLQKPPAAKVTCDELLGSAATKPLGGHKLATQATAAVLGYIRATQPSGALPIRHIDLYSTEASVVLDRAAVANLELVEPLRAGDVDTGKSSLLAVIDRTKTAVGGRMLRRWLLYPLTDVAAIRRRHDGVEFLCDRPVLRKDVREHLARIYDFERLASRASLGVATPRDISQLSRSIRELSATAALLDSSPEAKIDGLPELLAIEGDAVEQLIAIADTIELALVDEPPATVKDGGVIRDGYDTVVDERRELAAGGKRTLDAIEKRERERTGIPSLKLKFNRVFGYYLEVTNAHLDRVPTDYVRKQTLTGGERYVTTELAELEAKILAAREQLVAREQERFAELVESIGQHVSVLASAGAAIARVDTLAALADVAHSEGYVRPAVDDSTALEVSGGRHPVVEANLAAGAFVPNDCRLDTDARQLLLITGPNMAGKSTYMRQVGHIVLLAQMGAFVPAASAHLGVVDRLFTRVGASDNLSRGESTFMVEMRETAAILAGATERSLIVLDEVGRGTSTFDGVSIAWAVSEHIHDKIGARTLFATHYHELCALSDRLDRVHNVSVAVRERDGDIAFLRQVVPGGASRSYGIEVAKLAGVPAVVIGRARKVLELLEGQGLLGSGPQLSLFTPAPAPAPGVPDSTATAVIERLAKIDPMRTSPMDALAALIELRELL